MKERIQNSQFFNQRARPFAITSRRRFGGVWFLVVVWSVKFYLVVLVVTW
jgi:hypothetical protein